MTPRAKDDQSTLFRSLWLLAVVTCTSAGVLIRADLHPLREGASWGTYEIDGFAAAAVVAFVGLIVHARSNA